MWKVMSLVFIFGCVFQADATLSAASINCLTEKANAAINQVNILSSLNAAINGVNIPVIGIPGVTQLKVNNFNIPSGTVSVVPNPNIPDKVSFITRYQASLSAVASGLVPIEIQGSLTIQITTETSVNSNGLFNAISTKVTVFKSGDLTVRALGIGLGISGLSQADAVIGILISSITQQVTPVIQPNLVGILLDAINNPDGCLPNLGLN
ncbi:hypothetical protein XELAEV_18043876mg [Xenopus laevis]|uniref:Uncharacterized protein n=1 Tax=Xenopus laevis TaxID=8355 RepID=A0A974BXQ0_XENLA|nr:hypothetical protein XELAEV_18043876mg [Xenopus laevis]